MLIVIHRIAQVFRLHNPADLSPHFLEKTSNSRKVVSIFMTLAVLGVLSYTVFVFFGLQGGFENTRISKCAHASFVLKKTQLAILFYFEVSSFY